MILVPKVARTRPRSPRQAQIACSRECIVGAYSKLIGAMPDEKITISAICSTAGVGRQTFYRHFDDKKSVFTKRMYDGTEEYCDQLRKMPRGSLTLEAMLLAAFEFWKQHNASLNPLAQSKDLNHLFIETFLHIWRRIAKEFFPASESNGYDIEFQIAGIAGVFLHWLRRDMKESPEEITHFIVTVLDHHGINPK